MPLTIGTCLVFAVYHSPLVFIRTLLDMAEAARWAEGAALLRRGRSDASRSIHKALDTKHRLSD